MGKGVFRIIGWINGKTRHGIGWVWKITCMHGLWSIEHSIRGIHYLVGWLLSCICIFILFLGIYIHDHGPGRRLCREREHEHGVDAFCLVDGLDWSWAGHEYEHDEDEDEIAWIPMNENDSTRFTSFHFIPVQFTLLESSPL